jgi:hypothetical protein
MRREEAERLKDQLLRDMRRPSGTLRVGFHAGPGTGKSTTSALVFGALKQRGRNVEMSHEYAKDLTWEQRSAALSYQPYIVAKQMWRERRLDGQVEAILTDTSTLYSFIYGTEENGVTPAFKSWVLSEYFNVPRLDFFLLRDHERPYNEKGRNQTREEAEALDKPLRDVLIDNGVVHDLVAVDAKGNSHIDYIVGRIETALALQQEPTAHA